MFSLLQILVWLLMYLHTYESNEHEAKISSGLIFKKLPEKIIYQHTIPLVLTQPFGLNKDAIMDTFKRITEPNHEFSNIDEGYEHRFEMIQNLKKLVLEEAKGLIFEVHNTLSTRRKRGLHFMGSFFHFCCNVVNDDEINPIVNNEKTLKERYEIMREGLLEEHRGIIQTQTELKNLSDVINSNFEKMSEIPARLIDGTEVKTIALLSIQTVFQKYNTILNHCRLKIIPSNIINRNVLQSELNKLQTKLRLLDLELSIPIDNLSEYYKIKTTFCQFLENEIQIQIKIPVKKKLTLILTFTQFIQYHFVGMIQYVNYILTK